MGIIIIQETSNPSILKFEADRFLTNHNSYEFNNIDDAKNSPLAQQLFYLPFVKKVYIASNFVAIERFNIVEWNDVQDEVAEQLSKYIESGATVVTDDSQSKKAVTVYAESTPNPAVLKFVFNKVIVPQICEYSNIEEAKESPLATALFQFPFIDSVFLDKNYVSITKYDVVEWEEITQTLREFLKDYIENGRPVLSDIKAKSIKEESPKTQQKFEDLDDISKQIVTILEEHIKPAVASDGGNIEFKSFNSKTKKVDVLLQGACSGCPSSTFTLKNGIENLLKDMLQDQEISVNAINN
ncbi:NifU family protein [Winogradskyella sp. A3E31]|uniref:NifU family protein n=1 Tax=Winogradskyella sp. A3E31 TaxID=3349637 RepID=UPI00398ADC32